MKVKSMNAKHKNKLHFHVEIAHKDLSIPEPYYFIDQSEVQLILFIVHPYISRKSLILNGKEVSQQRITRVKIIATKFRFEPLIQSYIDEQGGTDTKEWMEENKIFNKHLDYSPHFLMYYKGSQTEKKVIELLDQKEQLEKSRDDALVKYDNIKVIEIEGQITKITANIAYILGAYTRGFVDFG